MIYLLSPTVSSARLNGRVESGGRKAFKNICDTELGIETCSTTLWLKLVVQYRIEGLEDRVEKMG